MKKYKPYLTRVDLVKNQVERERIQEQEAKRKRKQRIREQTRQNHLRYQEQLRSELAARYFHAVQSTGGAAEASYANTYSLAIDGTDDFVTMGNVLNMADDGTDAYSFSLWFRTSTNTVQQLIGKSATNGYNLYMQNGVIYFGFGTFGSNGIWGRGSVGTPLYNGTWHHLVLTYDGSQDISGFSMYFNDTPKVIQTSQNTTPSGVSTTNHFAIGARGNTGSPSLEFNGNIDEASYFNSELDQDDVTSIYNSGVPNDISSLSPVGWWRMGDNDGGTGTTVTDQGSGGNNGTLIADATFEEDVPS